MDPNSWVGDSENQIDPNVNQRKSSSTSNPESTSTTRLVVSIGNRKSHFDLHANQANSSSISIPASTPAQPDSRETQLMLTHPISNDVAIPAMPVSYCLPMAPYNTPPKERKNGSPSVKTTKRTDLFQKEYSAKWECISKQRKNGKWDKFYRHIEQEFLCRSLKEVEKYEKEGIRPRRKPKETKTENKGQIVKEMGAKETEETLMAKKMREAQRGKNVVEKFAADFYQNINPSCRDHHYSSDESERTPSPPPGTSIYGPQYVIPRY